MDPLPTDPQQHEAQPARHPLKRWLPLICLLLAIALAWALGLHKYLTLQSLIEHQGQLQDIVGGHFVFALLLYALVYVVVVALSLPGAALLSIFGGFVFGWMVSAPVTVFAATLGAVIVFKIVQTSLGAAIAERAGPFVQKLSDGFAQDGFNYLLFLRLVPAFPFFAVNAVAGLTRMNLQSFTLATLVGIIPGSIAFAWLGGGLGSVIEAQRETHAACVAQHGASACPYELSVSSLVTPQLLWAFAALGVVALIPVFLKRWKARRAL